MFFEHEQVKLSENRTWSYIRSCDLPPCVGSATATDADIEMLIGVVSNCIAKTKV